jgi:hypothetical protein
MGPTAGRCAGHGAPGQDDLMLLVTGKLGPVRV